MGQSSGTVGAIAMNPQASQTKRLFPASKASPCFS